MNKSELVDALASKTKASKAEAGRVIEALFATNGVIASELKKGNKVQITGFGNFETRKRATRKGRNPRTGKEITIKASTATTSVPARTCAMISSDDCTGSASTIVPSWLDTVNTPL